MFCAPNARIMTEVRKIPKNQVLVVYQLGDEELCRVYHAEFFAWYAQRAMVKGWLPASLSALEALYPARLAEV